LPADHGKDISRFFTNRLRMVYPIQRVNVDFTAPMLAELDDAAEELNISRQAVIKTLVREGLDRRIPRRGSSDQRSSRVRVSKPSRRTSGK
jgi:metal-responsive CopG/Arc/MetJ family transcriptional regulator